LNAAAFTMLVANADTYAYFYKLIPSTGYPCRFPRQQGFLIMLKDYGLSNLKVN
jgi:hypothetical protein